MDLELMKNYYYLYQWNPISFPNYVEVIVYLERSLNIGGCIDNLVHKLYIGEYRGNDIAKKLKIMRKSSVQYQDLVTKLIKYRNKIIHKDHLDINLIQDISLAIIALYTADNNFCDIRFFEDWNRIYYLMLQKCPPNMPVVDDKFDVKKFYAIFAIQWNIVYDKNLF